MALQIRRGTEAQRAALTGVDVPALGELLYTTDTKKLYIGDGVSGGGQDAGYFSSVAVTGQDTLLSSGENNVLTVVAGTNITLTTNDNTNSLTINGPVNFNGGTIAQLTVGEDYAGNPTDSFVDIEGGGNRLMRMGANMSTFGDDVSPFVQIAAYRASPANNDAGPMIEFRQSTAITLDEVIADIKSVVTNIANGAESGKLVFGVVDAADVVYIDATGFVGNLTGDVTGDVTGNVYAIDTTQMVDATNKTFAGDLVGNVTGSVTGDVKGSVFADDSTVLVDGPSGVLRGEHIGTLTGVVTTTKLTISDDVISTILPGDNIILDTDGGDILARGNLFTKRIDVLLDPTIGGVGVYNSTPTNSMISLTQAHNTASTTQPIGTPSTTGGPVSGSTLSFLRARGTLLSLQAVTSSDDLGSITFAGFDGISAVTSANIVATVPSYATVATGVIEGSIKLEVADATGTLSTKLKIEAQRISVLKPFNLVSVDNTARALLVPSFGDIIYNTSANKFQGYQNTSGTTPEWVDLS